MPKVSIVIRGKNEEDWLGLTIKAVKNQSFKDFEIKDKFFFEKVLVLPDPAIK